MMQDKKYKTDQAWTIFGLVALMFLGKIMFFPSTIIDLGALAIVVGPLVYTRYLTHKVNEFLSLESRLDALGLQVANLMQTQELVSKQAEDTKKILSTHNLASAFSPRKATQ